MDGQQVINPMEEFMQSLERHKAAHERAKEAHAQFGVVTATNTKK